MGLSHLRSRRILCAAIASVGLLPGSAFADRTYTGPANGSWNAALNWNPNGVPTPSDTAYIQNNDAVSRNVVLDVSTSLIGLTIGNLGSGANTLLQNSNFNISAQSETIGTSSAARGAHIQSNGTNTYTTQLTVGNASSAVGTYTLSGGTINLPTGAPGFFGLYVGFTGMGTFAQSGGTINCTHDLLLGFNTNGAGTYLLSGTGRVTEQGWTTIGESGSASWIQSGGTLTTTTCLVARINTQAVGTVTITNGTFAVTNDWAIGIFGSGTVNQSGGIASADTLALADGTPNGHGTYLLSGGSLSVTNSESIGEESDGTFLQTGGTHSTRLLSLGAISTGRGTLSLSGGSLSAEEALIGPQGTGTFSQSAGSMSVSQWLTLGGGFHSGSGYELGSGVGSLTGGTLSIAQLLRISSNSTFTQTGGYLSVGTIINQVAGPSKYFFQAGVLSIGSLEIGDSGPVGSDFSTTPTRSVFVNGTTTINPFSALTLNGGTFSTGTITGGGQLIVHTGTLVFNSSAALALALGDGAAVIGNSALSVNSGAVLSLTGGDCIANAGITNNGNILLQSPTSFIGGSILTNQGLLSGTGMLTLNLSNASNGTVAVGAGDTLRLTAGTNTSAGRITLGGGTIQLNQSLTNTGTISGRGTLMASTITNNGTVQCSGGFMDIYGTVNNAARITVTGGNTTTFFGNVSIGAVGSITVNIGCTVAFLGSLTGASKVTGAGIKDFEGTTSGGPIATVVGDTIVGTPANVTAQYFTEDDLSIFGNASISPNGTAASVSKVNTLSIAGGKLDLADNDLIVTTTPVATVGGYIATAFNGGDWAGNGLTSSSAAAASGSGHKTALGYATASSINASLFDGQSVSGSTTLVRYTYGGDANLDGIVNGLDFNALASNFGAATGKLWVQADFNYDGHTNSLDFTALASNFDLTLPSPPALNASALLPEPGSMLVLLCGILAARRRRV